MNNVGQVGSSAVAGGMQHAESATSQAATFQHSQLGAGAAKGLDVSMFEEAAMNIASSRKIETKDNKKDKENLKKLLEESKNKVPDMPGAEKLDQCLQKLKEKMKSGTLNDQEIKDQIGQYSGDATHQYLALEDLIAYLQGSEDERDKALASQLKAYNTAFYEEHRQDIQAGINISGIAEEFAENTSLGDTGDLRDIWRSALNVPDLGSALEAFTFAMQKSGGYEKVGEGIRWMTEALARELDLAQSERSVDATKMLHVRRQMECVFGVNTTYDLCVQVEKKLPGLILDESE